MAEPAETKPAEDLDHPVVAGVMASFLRAGRVLDHASSVLWLGLFVFMLPAAAMPARLAAIVAIAFGIAEKYYAWRVALDAELFAVLGRYPHEATRFDAALAACLGKAAPPEARNLASRWLGARGLLLRQATLLASQLAATLVAALA